jgi:LPXTG-site transpeptidase (sortase) family protein
LLPHSEKAQPAKPFRGLNILLLTAGILLIAGSSAAIILDARRTLAASEDVVTESEATPVTMTGVDLDDQAANGRGMRAALVDPARAEMAGGSPSAGALIPTRLVIPAIELDAVIVPAKSRLIKYEGKYYSQWVAPDTFAAGWHTYSAPLGLPGNTVLNGHHNEFGEVFRRLVELEPGDEVLVYSGDLEFDYKVVLKMILPERNQPAEVRLANAAWIMPTEDERLTLVTCWPYESNSHRLILVAKPAQAAGPEDQPQLP